MENNNNDQPQSPKEPVSAPILDVQPSQPSADPVDADAAAPTDATPTTETGAPDPLKRPEIETPKHGNAPIVPIILAIVIAAVLAVVTVLAFKNTKPASSTTQTQTQNQPDQPASAVTPDSVDATSAEIDQVLGNIDEAADFPETELTDEALGL